MATCGFCESDFEMLSEGLIDYLCLLCKSPYDICQKCILGFCNGCPQCGVLVCPACGDFNEGTHSIIRCNTCQPAAATRRIIPELVAAPAPPLPVSVSVSLGGSETQTTINRRGSIRIVSWNIQELGGRLAKPTRRHQTVIDAIAEVLVRIDPDICAVLEVIEKRKSIPRQKKSRVRTHARFSTAAERRKRREKKAAYAAADGASKRAKKIAALAEEDSDDEAFADGSGSGGGGSASGGGAIPNEHTGLREINRIVAAMNAKAADSGISWKYYPPLPAPGMDIDNGYTVGETYAFIYKDCEDITLVDDSVGYTVLDKDDRAIEFPTRAYRKPMQAIFEFSKLLAKPGGYNWRLPIVAFHAPGPSRKKTKERLEAIKKLTQIAILHDSTYPEVVLACDLNVDSDAAEEYLWREANALFDEVERILSVEARLLGWANMDPGRTSLRRSEVVWSGERYGAGDGGIVSETGSPISAKQSSSVAPSAPATTSFEFANRSFDRLMLLSRTDEGSSGTGLARNCVIQVTETEVFPLVAAVAPPSFLDSFPERPSWVRSPLDCAARLYRDPADVTQLEVILAANMLSDHMPLVMELWFDASPYGVATGAGLGAGSGSGGGGSASGGGALNPLAMALLAPEYFQDEGVNYLIRSVPGEGNCFYHCMERLREDLGMNYNELRTLLLTRAQSRLAGLPAASAEDEVDPSIEDPREALPMTILRIEGGYDAEREEIELMAEITETYILIHRCRWGEEDEPEDIVPIGNPAHRPIHILQRYMDDGGHFDPLFQM